MIIRDDLDRCNETVASARLGFDETRVRGGVAQRFAQLVDSSIQAVVEIDEGIGGPEAVAEVFAGDDIARALEQDNQYLERLFLELDFAAIAKEFARADIGFEDSEAIARDVGQWMIRARSHP